MKKLSLYLFFLAAVAAVPGCKKSNGQNAEPPDTLQLLTEKPWKLLVYGYGPLFYNSNSASYLQIISV